jgi:hypothetical protein
MKKYKVITTLIFSCLLAITLSACSSSTTEQNQENEEQNTQSQEEKTASVGDEVYVTTDKGDLKITVEGFTISQKETNSFAQYNQINSGSDVGILLLKIENVSYNSSSDNYVSIKNDIYAIGPDGVTLNPMNTADNYGEYEGAAGAYFQINQGQTKRIAVFYQVSPSVTSITVKAGDTSIAVNVTQGE